MTHRQAHHIYRFRRFIVAGLVRRRVERTIHESIGTSAVFLNPRATAGQHGGRALALA